MGVEQALQNFYKKLQDLQIHKSTAPLMNKILPGEKYVRESI